MLLLLTLQTLTLLSLFPLIHSFLTSPPSIPPSTNLLLPSDAVALLSFKSQADLDHKLFYVLNERFDYCQWEGVKCAQGRVVRFVLQGFGLRGVFSPNTLTRLDQLRVLSLRNNSLSGPVPDLSSLSNLKTLILNRNNFSGSFPPSVFALHRLRVLDFSFNNFTGPIPVEITQLDRLNSLRLEFNRFDGTLPPLNQSVLLIFNVSGNNLMGPIPLTPSLSRFGASSFLWNFGLCGEIVNIACSSHAPFFDSSNASSPQSHPLTQSAQSQGVVLTSKHKKTGLVPGVSIAVSVIVAAVLCLFALARKRHSQRPTKQKMASTETVDRYPNTTTTSTASMTTITNQISEMPSKLKIDEEIKQRVHGSGNLVFCIGETQLYTLDQLMRASAELLGRGTMGITYKAVLDNQLIVTVKRLDAGRTAITSSQAFERYMDTVGGLRHPNLVPVRAYFQAKGERLIIYDYQPNGSLFNLIHGSRSTRAKPLHWTSCLKIAEDVAQGLAYIHQASRLIHGNLKSTNVLLGSDFEACLTDYSLAMFADLSANDDPYCSGYKAPETRKSSLRATVKSDVYAFGVLLLELLTGKHPSQHPFLVPTDVTEWVRAMREDDVGEDSQLRMLAEVASICSLTSPEQRPAMWQVLKIINEIKESAMTEENLKL